MTHEARIQQLEEQMERYHHRSLRAEMLWVLVCLVLGALAALRYCG